MGVDGARGPPGCRGHGIDRDTVDALFGEEVSRCSQQPGPSLGLSLVLGLCHRSPPSPYSSGALKLRRKLYISEGGSATGAAQRGQRNGAPIIGQAVHRWAARV